MPRKRRLGVVGTMVWDVIHGRDPRDVPVEEWGGIAYALAAADAALPDDWELVPIMKVGADRIAHAREWMRTLKRVAPDARPIEVPYANNRVELRYVDAERRSELLHGGVPGWTWQGLAPLVADVDALYVNFISGYELDLAAAQLLRQHYRGPIYADLHSLTLGVSPTGLRTPQRLLNVDVWCRCFDFVQVNEDELALMAEDGMALAATALGSGVQCLIVTLGRRGHIYFSAHGFAQLSDVKRGSRAENAGAIRTALLSTPVVAPRDDADPTGCGDVFGATYFSRLAAGDTFEPAMHAATAAAARNASLRGATGLASFLRRELSHP
jgi:hypothetical protein